MSCFRRAKRGTLYSKKGEYGFSDTRRLGAGVAAC